MRLFLSFLRLGLTAFGGPAMAAYIRRMAIEERKWLDHRAFGDGVALCQTIPGATAMQVSAYAGFRVRGIAGAAVSFVGFGLPAFLLMVVLSALYARSYTLPSAVAIMNGLQVIVVAIVANAAVSFGKTSLKGFRDVIVAVLAAGMFGLRVSPILVIVLSALLGFVIYKDESLERSAVPSVSKPGFIRSLLVIAAVAALDSAVFRQVPKLDLL
jgi:chromate transporter